MYLCTVRTAHNLYKKAFQYDMYRMLVATNRCQYHGGRHTYPLEYLLPDIPTSNIPTPGIPTPGIPSPSPGIPTPRIPTPWSTYPSVYLPPSDSYSPLWTDTCLWKHYLPITTVTGGKNSIHLRTWMVKIYFITSL